MLSLLTWGWIFLLLSTANASDECPNLFPGCKCEKSSDGYLVTCHDKHAVSEVKKVLGLEDAESSSTQITVKDLIAKQAANAGSSTSSSSTASPLEILNSPGGNMLASFLPSMISQGSGGGGMGSNGFLGSFANTIPSLRNIPGFQMASSGGGGATGDPSLDMAIAQFSEPIVRFAAGEKPVPADIRQMVGTLPDLIVNLPGIGNVDLSKIPPGLLIHILRGGHLMGIKRSAVDNLIKQYTTRMYEAAVRSKEGHPMLSDEKYLPRLQNVSEELVNIFLEGKLLLPYLSSHQIKTIQEYYISQIPIEFGVGVSSDGNVTRFNPQMLSMLALLPPNYNFSKIPPEVITQVINGEMPDFSLLPPDLVNYLRANSELMFEKFKISPNASIDDVLSKLPRFNPAQHDVTFSPYDVNKMEADVSVKEEKWINSTSFRIFVASVIGVFVVVTVIIVSLFIYYLRKAGKIESQTVISESSTHAGDPDLEQSQFRPEKASTPISKVRSQSVAENDDSIKSGPFFNVPLKSTISLQHLPFQNVSLRYTGSLQHLP